MSSADGSGPATTSVPVELPPGRAYLSLGEVLDVLKEQFPDVTIAKIRFFEAQGLLVPERTPSGYRKFFPVDIERIRVILADQQERYVPLNAARAVVQQATLAEPASRSAVSAPGGGDGRRSNVLVDHGDGADVGDQEQEEDYEGVDLGSDRHPALRGRRQVGPPTPSRRPVSETRGNAAPSASAPAAPLAGSRANVAPIRRSPPSLPSDPTERISSGSFGSPGSVSMDPPLVAEAASYSSAELLASSGASEVLFDDAVKQGFLRGRAVLGETEFDDDDRRLLEALVTLGGSGLDPRHVRVFMHAAQREADLYVQATLPLLRRRPQLGVSVDEPFRRFGDLEAAGATLRGVVVRRALRAAIDGAPGPTTAGG